jgi:uncharacterized membrane protein YvbJ
MANCPNCGFSLTKKDSFCSSCGANIDSQSQFIENIDNTNNQQKITKILLLNSLISL